MSLTYKQSKLVQSTLPALREHGEQISSIFYATMLQEHPELKNYFNTVNQANGRQPRALTSIIIAFAANISHTSELIPKLERVCHKHCSLGIQPDQYAIVGEYLIRAFKEVLGPVAMTAEVESAWMDAYCVLARMMMGREAHLYRSFESWQTWRRLRVDRKVAESEDVYSFYLVPVSETSSSKNTSTSTSTSMRDSDSIVGRNSMSSVSSAGSRYSNFTSRLRTNNINIVKNKYLHNNTHNQSSVSVQSAAGSDGGGSLPHYMPGQYVSIRMLLPENPSDGAAEYERNGAHGSQRSHQREYHYQSRQYSLSDRWRPDYYRISVKRDEGTRFANAVAASYFNSGVVSNALIDQVNVGDTIEVSHPTGEFFLNTDVEAVNVPLVLISAGIGASPMMSILNSVAATQPRRAVSYVHGSRYAPPVFADALGELQHNSKMPRLRTAFFFSGPAPQSSDGSSSRSDTTSSLSSQSSSSVSGNAAARRSRDLLHATANAQLPGNGSARRSVFLPLGAHPTTGSSYGAGPTSSSSSSPSSGAPSSPAATREFTGHVDLRKLMPVLRPGTPQSEGTTTPTSPAASPSATATLGAADGEDDFLHLANGSTEYFVCGPESFMLDVAMHLVDELGVSRQRIRFELFSTGDLETDRRDERVATFLGL